MHGSLATNFFRSSRHLTINIVVIGVVLVLKITCTCFVISLGLCPSGGLSTKFGQSMFPWIPAIFGSNIMLLKRQGLFLLWYVWRFGGTEMRKYFRMWKKKSWTLINCICSYHYSMVNALGQSENHHVSRQVRWYPPPKVGSRWRWMVLLLVIQVMRVLEVF